MPLSEVILIIMGLLTVAMVAAGISRNVPIPYTVFLVILGIVFGAVARSSSQLEFLLNFQLTPELVFFLFLPALIFESAFNLDARQLLKDIAPIMALAIPALLINTAIIGVALWLILGMELALALLFGALISATDPVAVIALFKELGAPQRLTVLVEGESLLNDATAIVVFKIILGLVATGSIAMADGGRAVGEFLRVFAGGIVSGGVTGIVLSEILYRLRAGLSTYLIMSIVLAYAGFAIAEHVFHVSGVMAVIAGAVTMGIFGVSRIPQSATHVVKEAWDVIALVFNSLLFLLVGLSVDTGALLGSLDVIVIAVVLVLAARAATVYSMVPATIRMFHLPQVTLGERHIMWWGGLKGGLAIAIVLSVPADIEGREFLLNLTLGVVMFSLLVNAPTIRPLIHRLGIDRLTEDERAELKHGLIHAEQQADTVLQRMSAAGLMARSTRRVIQRGCARVFASDAPELDQRHDIRHLYISMLRIELEELKNLYDIGLIQQYIYLEMKNTLQRDRELWLANPEKQVAAREKVKPSIFLRIEGALIRRLREHDWAAGILARYQYLRLSQSLQRDIAGVLITTTVLERIESETQQDAGDRERVAAVYRARLKRRKERLARVTSEFPEFFIRFETRLFTKVALATANSYVEHSHQHGEIGAKAFTRIERRIRDALTSLPPISDPAPRLQPSELIGIVPLLDGLSTEVQQRLADTARTVTFLPNDIIIGEGERGDALYIITHGTVAVYRGDEESGLIAELRDGDFFGEMALLGDHVRTATVKARSPTSLLRLSRREVLELAATDPELERRLQEVRESRNVAGD